MKKKLYKRAAALLLGLLLAVSPCAGEFAEPFLITSRAEERRGIVDAGTLNVRSGPGTGYSAVARVTNGTTVIVTGEQKGTDGKKWYQIRFTGTGGAAVNGYVAAQYIRFQSGAMSDAEFENHMKSQGFPESYKPGLRELHKKYPQWSFTALHTGIDWNTAVENESVIGRNLVSRDSISSWKSTAVGAYDWNTGTWPGFDGAAWVQASGDIIRYYMDPRNFLNDKYIFQFMKQTYDPALHSKEGLESMVKGTFLSGSVTSSGGGTGGGMGPGSGPSGPMGGPYNGPGMASANPAAAGKSDHEVLRLTTAAGPGAGVPIPGFPGGNDASQAGGPVPPGQQMPVPGDSAGPGGGTPGPSPSSGPGEGPGGSTPGGSTPQPGGEAAPVSYADIIMNAAAQSGVNPYILASMILQEQGSQGTGRSISGTVPGYQGYYNHFNIEAYQSGSMSAVERGLWWASQSGSYGRPWNSVEKSILGGSLYYGTNYVKQGQDTLYLKKFNVQGQNPYKHQYMTNVVAAAAEGLTLAKIPALKTMPLVFSVPVFKNMPETPCLKPTLDGSPNNKLGGFGVEGFNLTPTFNRDTESYDLIVDPSVESVTILASALDSKAVVTGTGPVDLKSGINDIRVAVKAENGSVRNYTVHVVRQSNGPVYSDSVGGLVFGGGSSGPGGGPVVGPGGPAVGPGIAIGGSSGPGPGGGNGFNPGTPAPTQPPTQPQTQPPTQPAGQPGGGAVPVPPGQQIPGGPGSGPGGVVKPGTGPSPGGTPTPPQSGSGTKGDVNGDGKLNIMDVLKAQRHILGLETLSGGSAAAADVNGNGKVDVVDILLMQKDILGIQKLN